jgi:hypothetical protein
VNFPWYFVPATVGLALLAGLGLEALARVVAARFKARPERVFAALALSFAALALWAGHLGAVKLQGVAAQRERPYAAVARWIGARFPQGARIGANEIGAVGFFAPKHVETVDIYGLLRKHEDRALGSVDMVAKYRPEAVVVKKNFDYRDTIERSAMGPLYTWFDFNGVSVGLRRDVAPPLLAARGELHALYDRLDLMRQPAE